MMPSFAVLEVYFCPIFFFGCNIQSLQFASGAGLLGRATERERERERERQGGREVRGERQIRCPVD
jgi:hypothetical protein